MGTIAQPQSYYNDQENIAKMMKLVLLCVVGVVVADQGNTRFFGLGNLGGGLGHQGIGGVGGIGGIGGIGSTGARTPRVRPTAARATINLQDPWVPSPATALPCAPPAHPPASLEVPHRPAPTTTAAQASTSVATTPVWARRCASRPGAPEDSSDRARVVL